MTSLSRCVVKKNNYHLLVGTRVWFLLPDHLSFFKRQKKKNRQAISSPLLAGGVRVRGSEDEIIKEEKMKQSRNIQPERVDEVLWSLLHAKH